MENEVSKLRQSTGLVKWIAAAGVFALLAPPLALAGGGGGGAQKVKGTVTAKVKDTGGGRINSDPIPPQGLFDAPGSTGAMDVSIFSGGGGILAAGDCDPGVSATAPQTNTATIVPDAKNQVTVTSILLTGSTVKAGAPDAQLRVAAAAISPNLPLLGLEVGSDERNAVFSSPYGITPTDDLIFTCTAPGGGDGDGQWIILGSGPQG